MAADFTLRELMIVAAARQIGDGDVVFTGMRLPLLAFCVAKKTHAPDAIGLFEVGIVRDTPPPELLFTMSDPPNIRDALWCTGMLNVMALLQRGHADMAFIGAAEVDRYGNVNTSYVGEWRKPRVKLPGSGGAADLAALARRSVVIVDHNRQRLPARVGFVTSPGFGDGPGWRERVGLPRGGPAAVVTSMAVLGFDADSREAVLVSYHPGTTIAAVCANTGWDLRVAPDAAETPAPTAQELAVIRAYDPAGHWRAYVTCSGRQRRRALAVEDPARSTPCAAPRRRPGTDWARRTPGGSRRSKPGGPPGELRHPAVRSRPTRRGRGSQGPALAPLAYRISNVTHPSGAVHGPWAMPGGRQAYIPLVNVWFSRRSCSEPSRIHTSSQNACRCTPSGVVSVPGAKRRVRV